MGTDNIGSLMGAVFAMDHYQATFNTGMTGQKVSVVTSLYTVYAPVRRPCLFKSSTANELVAQWLQLPFQLLFPTISAVASACS
jgi:hypothetical protein